MKKPTIPYDSYYALGLEVYYDLGLFKDAKDVECLLNNHLSFLIYKEKDIHIMTGKNNDKFIFCNPAWHEFVTTEQLHKYYLRAKEIYFPEFEYLEDARGYYEKYLGSLGIGDLYSLTNKDGDYVVFLIMYLLMLKDGVIHKKC